MAGHNEHADWKLYIDRLTMSEIAELFVTAQDRISWTGFNLFKDEKLNSDRRQEHRLVRERISGQVLRAKDIDPPKPLTDYQHHQILEAARDADRQLMKTYISTMNKGEFVFITKAYCARSTSEGDLVNEFLNLLLEHFGIPRKPKEVTLPPPPIAVRNNRGDREDEKGDYFLIPKKVVLAAGLLLAGIALMVFSGAVQPRSN